MENVWILFKHNLYVSIIKKKKRFIISLLILIVILLILGKLLTCSNATLNIGIIDKDKSNTSIALSEFLQDTDVINIVEIDKYEIKNELADKSIHGAITFPRGFEESILNYKEKKIVITALENDNVKEILSNILYQELITIRKLAYDSYNKEDYLNLMDSYKSDRDKMEIKLLVDSKEDHLKSNVLVGVIIFFMLIAGFLGALHYYEENNSNILNKFFICPITKKQYYIAEILSNYLIVIIQALIGIIIINIIKVNINVNNIMLFIIMALVGLVSVSLAICIRAFCNNRNEFNIIFNFISVLLIIIGGCFVPLEMMPKLINNISYLIPTGWAMKAVSDLQLGLMFKDVLPHLFILLLFSVLFFTIGEYKTIKLERN